MASDHISARMDSPAIDGAPDPNIAERIELVRRLRDTPNWLREKWGGDWKSTVTNYDRAPFEAADVILILRDTLCRTLDKVEFYARQGQPLPQDEIDAMTERMNAALECNGGGGGQP